MKKVFGYIYKSINLTNNRFYVGKHESVFLTSAYLGSGVVLKNAIKKYGRENFIKEILETCYSRKELNKREIFWIKTLDAKNPKTGYNQTEGGTGGSINKGKKFSKEWSNNISKARLAQGTTENHIKAKQDADYLKRQSVASLKVWSRPCYREKASLRAKQELASGKRKLPMLGRKHTEENKQKARERHSKSIISTNTSTGEEIIYDSIYQATIILKCKSISYYISTGRLWVKNNLIFKYKE